MKKLVTTLMICAAVILFTTPPALADDEPTSAELKIEAKQAKINEVADETLQTLFKERPKAKDLYDKAVGWAVFDNTKVAFGLTGGGGNGVAVSKSTGEKTYMKMGTAGVGLGIGVNKYQIVFLFQDEDRLKNFVTKGWQADASATAAAGTNAADAKTDFSNGIAIYQFTEKGLMVNADVAGTKYWANDNLNE